MGFNDRISADKFTARPFIGAGILSLFTSSRKACSIHIHDCPYILQSVSKSGADFRDAPEFRTPRHSTPYTNMLRPHALQSE